MRINEIKERYVDKKWKKFPKSECLDTQKFRDRSKTKMGVGRVSRGRFGTGRFGTDSFVEGYEMELLFLPFRAPLSGVTGEPPNRSFRSPSWPPECHLEVLILWHTQSGWEPLPSGKWISKIHGTESYCLMAPSLKFTEYWLWARSWARSGIKLVLALGENPDW